MHCIYLFCSVQVSDVLWNLYSYYKQFIPCIEQTLQEMRKPIEKDLKVSSCYAVKSGFQSSVESNQALTLVFVTYSF